MLRALLWKEWREQRQIAAAGIGLALIMPVIIFAVVLSSGDVYRGDIADMIPFMMAAVVWPLFAALAGASTNAEEANDGSLGFLLSRPVPRWSVWAAKVAIAAVVLVIIIGGSFGLSRVINWSVGGYGITFPFSSDPVDSSFLSPAAVQIAALGFPLGAFASSVFLSMFVRRQAVAAVAGVGAAFAIVGAGAYLQAAISGSPRASYGSESFLLGFFLVTTGAILLGSFYVFLAGGMLQGADKRRPVERATIAILIVVLVGTALVAQATTHIDPATARLSFVDVFPDGQGVVLRARRSAFSGESYWLARPDEPIRRLTARLVAGAVVTPDGEALLYRTRATALGFRSEACQYREVRPDGTGDRLVADEMPCSGDIVFSEDGRQFAVGLASRLLVGSIDGGADPRRIMPNNTPAWYGEPLRWTSSDSRVVMLARRSLSYLDVETGKVTELYGHPQLRRLYIRAASSSRLVIEADFRDADELQTDEPVPLDRTVLVNLETGHVEDLPEHCPERALALALSPDGGLLFYPGCPNSASSSEGQLRVRNLETGDDRSVATFDGQLYGMMASPGSRSFMATIRNHDEEADRSAYRDFVVDLDGNLRDLEIRDPNRSRSAWRIGQWVDESRLMLSRRSSDNGSQFAYLDPWTGEIQILTGDRGGTGGQPR